MASSSSHNSPCAACKFLRRKCLLRCIFAPYFPPDDPQKFANVHKIFGASNVTKLLNEILPHQRQEAANSLAYEAAARIRDPVYGCVGVISFLHRQVEGLQKELDAANADLIRFTCSNVPAAELQPLAPQVVPQQPVEFNRRFIGSEESGGGRFYRAPSLPFPYTVPWNDDYNPQGGGYHGSV